MLYNPTRITPPSADLMQPLTAQDLANLDKKTHNLRRGPRKYAPPKIASVHNAPAYNAPAYNAPKRETEHSDAELEPVELTPYRKMKRPRRDDSDMPSSSRAAPSGPAPPTKGPAPRKGTLSQNSAAILSSVGQQDLVTQHYNALPQLGTQKRSESRIYGLRLFNNWIKAILFRRSFEFIPRSAQDLHVIDVGCGKGGDLIKWVKAGASYYVGVDIAEISVRQAQDRYANMRQGKMHADFVVSDCFGKPFPHNGILPHLFDIASLQFDMHYAFDTEENVRQMLQNVSSSLKLGGVMLGTIPDSLKLLEMLYALPEGETQFGNELYSVAFDERGDPYTPRRPYGDRYLFTLIEAVESVPEFLILWDSFTEIAAEYGLAPVLHRNFLDMFSDAMSDDPRHYEEQRLLRNMKVINAEGDSELNDEQFEACSIYAVFILQKVRM